MRLRRLRRRLLLWGLGDPRAPLTAAAPGASGTTARPSAFRHGLARGGRGAGLTQTPGTRATDSQAFPRGGSGSARLLRTPGGARATSESARTRGPSLRAVLALARRRLLRPARPRHWVGVSERGGEPRPHPARRRGAGPVSRSAPRPPGRGCSRRALCGSALESPAGLWCAGSAPLLPPPSSGGRYPASGNPGFPGRGPGPEKTVRERAQPLGSAEHVVLVTRCLEIG